MELLQNLSAGPLLGVIEDLAETREVTDAIRGTNFTAFSYVWLALTGNIDPADNVDGRLVNALRRVAVDFTTGTAPSIERDLQRWLTKVASARSIRPASKVVLVGHSEGTALSNLLYQRIPDKARPTYVEKMKCVRQMSVGLIDSRVLNGQYVTSQTDLVIFGAFASPVGFNPPRSTHTGRMSMIDPSGHNFVNSYLRDATLLEAVRAGINNQARIANDQCVQPEPQCPDALVVTDQGFSQLNRVWHYPLPDDDESVHDLQFNHINNATVTEYSFSNSATNPDALILNGEPLVNSTRRTFDGQLEKIVFSWATEFHGRDVYLHARGRERDSEYSFCLSCNGGDAVKCNAPDGTDRSLGEGLYQITWGAVGYRCGACLTGSVSTRPTNNCGFRSTARWYPNILEGVDLPLNGGSNTSTNVRLVKGETYDLTFDGICQCESVNQDCRGNDNTGRVGWTVREILPEGGLGPAFRSVNRSIGTALRRQIDVPAN